MAKGPGMKTPATQHDESLSFDSDLPKVHSPALPLERRTALPVTRGPLRSKRSVAKTAPPAAEESDEDLMARLACCEQSALETLLDRYSRIITGVIFNVVRDEAETEEVLMEVFLHSWKNAALYSPAKGKALGWLVTMARRRGIDRLRKRQRYSAATDRLQVEVEHDPEAWISSRHNAEKDTECSDLRTFIKAKLAELPEAQRNAIELTFYKGMSQREIAAQTGIPLGTIKTRIELGLKKLSTSLQSLSSEF